MSSPSSSPSRRYRFIIGALCLLAVGSGVWWGRESPAEPGAAPTLALRAGPVASGAPVAASATEFPTTSAGEEPEWAGSLPEAAPVPRESSGGSLDEAVDKARSLVMAMPDALAGLPQNEGVSHFAANAGQDLTARFRTDGAVKFESGKAGKSWQATLRHAGGSGDWKAEGSRVERPAGTGVTEWYVNGGTGVEHGFTLTEKPAGRDADGEAAWLFLTLDGLRSEADPERPGDLRFTDPATGDAVLGYQKLLVRDAAGRELPSRMSPDAGGVRISWQDAGAVYPVTVDPLVVSFEQALDDPAGGVNDYAGLHAALDGDTAVVGALNDDTPAGANAGSVLVFRKTGTVWQLEEKVLDPGGAANDRFGVSVGLSGNTLVAGSDYDDEGGLTDNGSATVFVRSGTAWTRQGAKLVPAGTTNQAGRAVAVDGNTVVIGGPRAVSSSGRAWVYVRTGTTWALQQTLASPFPENNTDFGYAVDIHGDRVIIGSPRRGTGFFIPNHGQASIFHRSGTAWTHQANISPASAESGEQAGFSVAIHGDMAVMGAPGTPPGWTAASPAHATSRGRAFYSRYSGSWSAASVIPAPVLTDGGFYGFAVDVQREVVAIAGIGMDGTRGQVHLRSYRAGGTWAVHPVVQPAGLSPVAWFGTGVSLSGNQLLAGAHGGGTSNAGRAFVFNINPVEDASINVTASGLTVDTPHAESFVAIRSVPGKEGFRLPISGSLQRWDSLDVPLPVPAPAGGNYFPATFAVNYRVVLHNETDNLNVPLQNAGLVTQTVTAPAFVLNGNLRSPYLIPAGRTLDAVPVNAGEILPNKSYRFTVSVSHMDGAVEVVDVTRILSGVKLISLSGQMAFGNIATTLTAVTGNPAAGSVVQTTPLHFRISVTIPAARAYVTGNASQTFGGGPLTMRYTFSGTGQGNLSMEGAQSVQVLPPADGSTAGIKWSRGAVFLFSTGAQAQNFRIHLPAGFGYASSESSRRCKRSLPVNVALDPQFNPTGSVIITPVAPATRFWFTHERVPAKMRYQRLTWEVATGTLSASSPDEAATTRHVRIDETFRLASAAGTHGAAMTDGDTGHRKTNDGYMIGNGTVQNLVVKASPQGYALLSCQLQNTYSSLNPHFPLGVQIYSGQSSVTWVDSRITTGTVTASGGAIQNTYSTIRESTPLCGNLSGTERTAAFTATGGIWKVTPDGGLRAEGTIGATDLAWGRNTEGAFTHTVQGVTRGSMLIAGTGLRGATFPGMPMVNSGDSALLPGIMLLSGHGSPANAALVERFGSKNYDAGMGTAAEITSAGLADYPGLNIRADYGIPSVLRAVSRVAGEETPVYDLKARSKYNVRRSGVTGVHEGVTSQLGALSGFYNYNMELDLFGLAYLDCQNTASTITGSVDLPMPSGIELTFAELLLSATGHLESVRLTGNTNLKLKYWNVPIAVSSMEFATVDECLATDRTLLLAVMAQMPAVTNDPMQARLGIEYDGNLTTGGLANNKPTDSRFSVPASINLKARLDGTPENEGVFRFTPVTQAALNNPDAGGGVPGRDKVAGGFVSLAGAMDVPFFDDMQVHVLMSSSSDATADSSYFITGGWKEADKTFFNDAAFDSTNRGFPNVSGLTFQQYRDGADAAYLPTAHRNWRNILDLTYPLKWEPGGRQFSSPADEEDEILVLTVEHQIQKMTSRAVAMTFGTSLGTPKLNLATLAAEGLTGGLRNALPDPSTLLAGVEELEKLLTDRFERTLESALGGTALDAQATALLDGLEAYYESNVSGGRRSFVGLTANHPFLATAKTSLTGKITSLANAGTGVSQSIQDALGSAIISCETALTLVRSRSTIRNVVTSLSDLGGGDYQISSVPQSVMDQSEEALVQAEQLLEMIHARLTALQTSASYLTRIRTAFQSFGAGATDTILAQITASYVNAQDLTGEYMEEFTPAQHRERLKAIIRRHLSGAALAGEVQPILRGAFTEIRNTFRTALDQVFAEINRILQNAAKEVFSDLVQEFKNMAGNSGDQTAAAIANGAGTVGDFGATADVRGYARINDEEIEFIRLDAMMKLNVAVSLEVETYFEMRNINSSTPNTSCRAPGVVATEVSVGAAADADFGPVFQVAVKLDGRFSFGFDKDENNQDIGPLKLKGLDGSFDLRAKVPVKQASLTHMAAKFGFGGGVGFISGQIEGTVYAFGANGSCFFGFSKNPEDFNLVDPQTREVLGLPQKTTLPTIPPIELPDTKCLPAPLIGFYTNLDLDVSLNQIFGIPDTCFLRVTGHVGAGNFVFFQKRNDRLFFIPGVRFRYGVSGEVLCVLELSAIAAVAVKAELDVTDLGPGVLLNPTAMLDTLSDATATGYGEITFSAKVVVIKVSKTLGIKIELSKDDVDVSFHKK